MKKLKLLLLISLFSLVSYSQVRKETIKIAYYNKEQNTLYLPDNTIGCEIKETWEIYYFSEMPIIILTSEEIITEFNRKQRKNNKT